MSYSLGLIVVAFAMSVVVIGTAISDHTFIVRMMKGKANESKENDIK